MKCVCVSECVCDVCMYACFIFASDEKKNRIVLSDRLCVLQFSLISADETNKKKTQNHKNKLKKMFMIVRRSPVV